MDQSKRELFQKLHDESLKDYETFKKKRYKAIWRSQIEKYPETAHFVYELLQNADDARATNSLFVLSKECLVFKHNGTKHFDITDVDNEDIKQGDINAICSLWSSKAEDDVTIGKFGVGFKSVFKYVDSPEIYDDEFKFKIDNYIVPTEIETDHQLRQKGETLFVLRFKEPEKAFKHIEDRLKELKNPILYLNHLKSIEWKYADDDVVHSYNKEVHKEFEKDGVTCEDVFLTSGEKQVELYLFTKKVELINPNTGNRAQQNINVAYYLKEDRSLDVEKGRNIFCFFATSDSYGMCFESHGPFMLNESRTNILRDDNDVNEVLDDSILELASQALLYLKEFQLLNENLFAMVPKETEYLREKGMLALVKNKYKEVIKNNELILARDGTYKYPSKVRRGASPELERLIDKSQLNQLLKTVDVDFVAVKNREEINSNESKEYFAELGIKEFNNDELARCVDGAFLDLQQEWIGKFYNYISEYARQLWNKNGAALRTKPIIKTTGKVWKSPYYLDERQNEQPNVYLPTESFGKEKTDCFDFVDNEHFQKYERFFKDLGLKEPDSMDFIDRGILPKYRKLKDKALNREEVENGQIQDGIHSIWVGTNSDVDYYNAYYKCVHLSGEELASDFQSVFRIWKDSNDSQKKSVADKLIKDWWICAKKYDGEAELHFLCKIRNGNIGGVLLFDDNDQMTDFYPFGCFVDYEKYISLESVDQKEAKEFFKSLGVKFSLIIQEEVVKWWSASDRILSEFRNQGISQSAFQYYNPADIRDYKFEGWSGIPSGFNEIQSKLVWACICDMPQNEIQKIKTASCTAKRKYHTNESPKLFETDSTMFYMLKHDKWIYKEKKISCSPNEITKEEFLALGYGDCTLIKDLGFKLDSFSSQVPLERPRPVFFGTPEQQQWQKIGKRVEDLGLTEEELKEFAEEKRRKAEVRQNREKRLEYQGKPVEIRQSIEGLGSGTKESKQESDQPRTEYSEQEPRKQKTDRSVELQKFIDKQNEKIQNEEEKEELRNSMDGKQKYSKGWFSDGLKIEYLNAKEDSKDKIAKSISLSFSRVTPEHSNVYCFSDSSQLIPRWLEELDGDLKVTLRFVDGEDVNVNFAMASVQDFSLKLRGKGNDEDLLKQIAWDKLTVATLDVNNPKGLVKNLSEAFSGLPFPDDFDMKSELKDNLKFVFGPPGTGKTYYLAHEIITKRISEGNGCRILVLTPTNQAADVITKELVSANPNTYKDWLGRFVATNDQEIEDWDLVWDRKSTLYRQKKCCLVSTIARLSYDFFENDLGDKFFIKDMDWDCVICDEGSMISLPEIMYAIYKFSYDRSGEYKGVPIFIAGDPKQLQPIDTCGVWGAENVYDVVELNSFKNPQTQPIQFEVVNLKQQRRSVPAIGELFSRYSYDGMLEHYRKSEEILDLHLDMLKLKPITYLPFYVNNFDDIYGAKKMSGSNVHIYSAILTAELCRYIAKEYARNAEDKKLKIGVICPYIAQVQLIDRLLSGYNNLPSVETVEIHVGTIHSFQGDECNIVFALFNPPKGMASKKQDQFTMLLNDDHLVNVAISRARDYLCIMVPNENSYGRENLTDVNKVADVIESRDFPNKDFVGRIDCEEIESLLFGERNYLKNNSFVTSHQMANVYTPSNFDFEIRVDENAIDIQIGNR